MVTAITCTGSRPEAFKLCHSYMVRQTYKEPIQWLVITDDANPSYLKPFLTKLPEHIKAELYLGPETWKPGLNTHQGNMLEALSHVDGDKICFFEDDDFYSPLYLEQMSKLLEHVELAGEANACYYNLVYPGWKRMQNYAHASLCQTAIRASMLSNFEAAVKSGNKFFDIELWKGAHQQGKPCAIFSDVNLCVGIKGMPGRTGIGVGHELKGYMADPYLAILKRWLGTDVTNYLPFAKGLSSGKEKQIAPRVQIGQKQNSKEGGGIGGSGGRNSSISNKKGVPQSQAQKPNA